MLERIIKTSQQQQYRIHSDDPTVASWFSLRENCCDIILKQINEERMYDPIFMGRQDMTVVDLGANIGLFSLYAFDSATRMISVEPTPTTFGMLTKLTKDIGNIERIHAAIGDRNEPVTFYINENPTVNSLVNKNGSAVSVPGMTLEHLFKSTNIDNVDFCKCDIEGSEMTVLTEATLDPVKDIVKFWFIEVHQTDVTSGPWPGNLENNRQQLAAVLRNAGYSVEPVINDQLYAWR